MLLCSSQLFLTAVAVFRCVYVRRDKTNPSGVETAGIIELKTQAVIIHAVVAVYDPFKWKKGSDTVTSSQARSNEFLRNRESDQAT